MRQNKSIVLHWSLLSYEAIYYLVFEQALFMFLEDGRNLACEAEGGV